MKVKRFLMLTAMLLLITSTMGVQSTSAQGNADNDRPPAAGSEVTCSPMTGKKVAIDTAKLIIEYNATDNDIGVHGAFDDHGWSELCVFDPKGKLVLAVKPQSELKDLTMAGIFFESREPPAAEFSFADLAARFPEGKYKVRAQSFDGTILTGSALFTHDVPAAPTVNAPADGAMVPTTGLAIQWENVTETVNGDPVTITGYEVIVTKVNHDDPNGFSQPIFDVHVPPDRNSLTVSNEFLKPGTEYELEVLALEVSGNQTITSSSFTTE